MTYGEAVQQGTAALQSAGVPEAELDAYYLLEHCTGMNRTQFFIRNRDEMPEAEAVSYRKLLKMRRSRIPLQHLTGEQDFMGLSFLVNEHVLVPRQDTELLVEEALKRLEPGMRVLDMCTGSGCVILSLVSLCPGIAGTGADLSEKALETAVRNRDRLGVRAELLKSDLFEHISGEYDLIVSNPPYITSAEIEELMPEVRLHEPLMALDGGQDGLYFYRRIIQDSLQYLKHGGWLMFEIGCSQGKEVSELMKENEFTDVQILKDLAGLDRVVTGCRK